MGIRASRPRNNSYVGARNLIRRHSALMVGYILTGMPRDEAAKRAYRDMTK